MAAKYSLGLDYGTNSVRAIIVDVSNGDELATAVADYKRGDAGVITDASNVHVARQHPQDYLDGLVECVASAMEIAKTDPGFSPADMIGIGVDTTGSTPIPVNAAGTPLALTPKFGDNINALAWLWKDHSSVSEAEQSGTSARSGTA